VTEPTKTTERIVEISDGKGFKLLSEEEKRKADVAQRFESMGLLQFSHDEEDELSLETVHSSKSKGSNKSKGSQKLNAKPKPTQPVEPKSTGNLMPRTALQQVKEDEKTPFHEDAFSAAGGFKTPSAKGSTTGGWIVAPGSGRHAQDMCQLFAPKALGNVLHLRNPTPPNSGSDSGSAGSSDSNRHAALQDDVEEEVSDATTDILPVEEIPESIQEGAAFVEPDSNETPDNIQAEVAEPVGEESPQPDGVASSKDADFVKAESEQVLPSIRRPTN